MWILKTTKPKSLDYKRMHCIEWLREQIEDWEAEQIRLAVRSGALNGINNGTCVPGGDGTWLAHIAAPAAINSQKGRNTKAQKKQSAEGEAKHHANVDVLVAAGFPRDVLMGASQ